MQSFRFIFTLPMLLGLALATPPQAGAQRGEPAATRPARMTVTLRTLGKSKRTPDVGRDDVVVNQGKDRLEVTGWTPASGARAGMDLFLLIDDAADSSLSLQYDDLRSFINAQPSSTSVGVGYMRNGTVQIAQDFTPDHELAARALRLPFGSTGAYGSPYLSVIDLMKRWPESGNRREVVMITDGIDRFRALRYRAGLPYISPDVDSASRVAQRTGTMIHTIFTRGVGRLGNNFWEINNGQNSIAKLSDETGGESYFLGKENAVSFRAYLDDIQRVFDSQYLLEFRTVPDKQARLQYVRLSTPVAGVELDSADSVWVEAR